MYRQNRFSLSDKEIGEITERKLIEAARQYPASWLVKIERSSPLWDMRKVDTVAHVKYPNGDVVLVLIQVKSKEKWRQQFLRTQSQARDNGVIPLVVGLKDNHIEICLRLYRELAAARQANRRYDTFIRWLNAPAEGRGIRHVREIEQDRRMNPVNPHSIHRASFWQRLHLWWAYQ